jgi:hypothetical protein
MDKVLLLLYIIAIIVIGFLLYSMTDSAQKQKNKKQNRVQNGIPPPQRFNTHWWGYGWRPWWRRYGGVPGLDKPEMPVAPKPVVINTKPILY